MTYFNSQEEKDLKWFENEFNQDLRWFAGTTGTTEFTRWDVECEARDGRRIDVELKMMDKKRDRFNDIYIEPDKLKTLQERLDSVEKTLYINYTDDKKIVYVWDISKIDIDKLKYYPEVKIWDKGKQEYKIVPRYGLPKNLCCATCYKNKEQKYTYK